MPVTAFAPQCVQAVRGATEMLGYSHMEMVSGAGHDSLNLATVAPTGMIFVPCENGISHNEIENAMPEDLEAGCNVLLHAMLAMDAVPDE
jgi:N-carbamoyl-L-amino-acid hydrolase